MGEEDSRDLRAKIALQVLGGLEIFLSGLRLVGSPLKTQYSPDPRDLKETREKMAKTVRMEKTESRVLKVPREIREIHRK